MIYQKRNNQRKKKNLINDQLEREFFEKGFRYVIGIDEVGRGCIAGPVVVAAYVHEPSSTLFPHVDDSKKVTPRRRKIIREKLRVLSHGIGVSTHEEIDSVNIINATRMAIDRAIDHIEKSIIEQAMVLVDGYFKDPFQFNYVQIKGGDALHYSIAAASILAKEHRDELMRTYGEEFPEYGFENHVGYGTKYHKDALKQHGVCKIHRKSFQPIASMVGLW